jgi:drug/metabolite transporter (DMT)-like permease
MVLLTFGSLVGPFAGVVLCMIAVRNCHAGVVATILGTMPIFILPFAIFLYGERVSFRALGGALVSVAGIALLIF